MQLKSSKASPSSMARVRSVQSETNGYYAIELRAESLVSILARETLACCRPHLPVNDCWPQVARSDNRYVVNVPCRVYSIEALLYVFQCTISTSRLADIISSGSPCQSANRARYSRNLHVFLIACQRLEGNYLTLWLRVHRESICTVCSVC